MQRIQRKRTKGSKMPHGAKYVGRWTKWGNPFRLTVDGAIECHTGKAWTRWTETTGHDTQDIVDLYGRWLDGELGDYPHLPAPPSIDELKGKDLACWCSLESPCHVDAILERLS